MVNELFFYDNSALDLFGFFFFFLRNNAYWLESKANATALAAARERAAEIGGKCNRI